MGGCSGGPCGPETKSSYSGSPANVEELVKASSLEEANELIKDRHVLNGGILELLQVSGRVYSGKNEKEGCPCSKG